MARFATGSNVRVLIATILGSLVTVASPAVRADVPASSEDATDPAPEVKA